MGNIMRLALLAGSGTGMAGLRRCGIRLAWFVAACCATGLLALGATAFFGMAIWYAVDPKLGPAWASAISGAALCGSAAILWLSCRHWYLAPRRSKAARAPLEPRAALDGLDIPRLLERNATGVLLAAFVAGMVMNRRR